MKDEHHWLYDLILSRDLKRNWRMSRHCLKFQRIYLQKSSSYLRQFKKEEACFLWENRPHQESSSSWWDGRRRSKQNSHNFKQEYNDWQFEVVLMRWFVRDCHSKTSANEHSLKRNVGISKNIFSIIYKSN